ncbi:hypothetical protein [Absidia glauca]|uniref:Corrinoid adenosyltransferase MMAB n=1 Tax=Absidia glauca TaxID=4829 RepID=A0A163J921_ABSGL|nr:hypothetical protein [Absidia glauca]
MKIYTKTGDKGTSSLYNGERRNKDDLIFEALGTTDELSCNIGLAMEYLEDDAFLKERLEKIQCLLQDIGSNIATPRDRSNANKLARTTFDPHGKLVLELEQWIDAMDEELPRLTQFILPSGGKASATLHVSRAVCRRAERCVQPLNREHLCDDSVTVYLNRLAAKHQGKEEKVYVKPRQD